MRSITYSYVICLGTDLVLSLSCHIICLCYVMSSGARFTRIEVLINDKKGVWGGAGMRNDGTKSSRWQKKKKGGAKAKEMLELDM